MTPELLIALTDQFGAGYAALRGDADNGHGCGYSHLPLPEASGKGQSDYGLSLSCRRITQIIMETHDISLIGNTIINAPRHFQQISNLAGLAAGTFATILTSIGHQCRVPGTNVNGIESYAAYYNTGAGGPWNCLLSPLYAELHSLLWPSSPIPASSVLAAARDIASLEAGRTLVQHPGNSDHSGHERVYAYIEGAEYSENGDRVLAVEGASVLRSGAANEKSLWSGPLPTSGKTAGLFPASGEGRLLSVSSISLPSAMIAGKVIIRGAGGRDYPLVPK